MTEQQTEQDNHIALAAAIYAALLTPDVDLPSHIAGLLLALGLPEAVGIQVARSLLSNLPAYSPDLPAAHETNLTYRAAYIAQAAQRIASSLARGMNISEALKAESANFQRHKDAEDRRTKATRLISAAMDLYQSNVLSWHHTRAPQKAPRPNHVEADHKNFRVDTIPALTEALPSFLPGCQCSAGAPIPGAVLLS